MNELCRILLGSLNLFFAVCRSGGRCKRCRWERAARRMGFGAALAQDAYTRTKRYLKTGVRQSRLWAVSRVISRLPALSGP